MNKKIKNYKILISLLCVILLVSCTAKQTKETPTDVSEDEITDISEMQNISQDTPKSLILDILKTNPDSLEYINKYKDFEIVNKTVLTKESILEGQNATRFKEVYFDLSLENNRYLKVDLMNKQEDRGLIAVLDMETKTVAKAYWLILSMMG